MADPPDARFVAAHIESISTRGKPDGDRLVLAMLGRCWPGGSFDRREPGAVEWLRRWGPFLVVPAPAACSCSLGRCRLCN